MKRAISMLWVTAVLLAGCADPAATGPGGSAMSQFVATPVAGLPACQQYNATATLGGKPQPLTGEACRQPDGSWHIAEQPAGTTAVYQTVYWPPPDVAYNACFDSPYDAPCLYDFPFGFSVGFPVFIDIHRHFDHFVYDGSFHHFGPSGHFGSINRFADAGGFHPGFHNGFHGGFAGGFHGGFPGGGSHPR
jgi:hypothetical protein